jgi:glycerol-3-phosphate acyltransferase PlsY
MIQAVVLILLAYLIGAIPFGYLIGRARGVNLFREGSGNVGATNAARTLGRPLGTLVFILDFLKGALPVAVIVPLAEFWNAESARALPHESLRVGAAAAAFLGHLFPIYLGFRGGKGVATGAGAVAVLVPIPAAIAFGTWCLAVLATRMVSLASLSAVGALVAARFAFRDDPFSDEDWLITAFCIVGALVVIAKHRTNVGRIWEGSENRISDGASRRLFLRMLHLLAVGFWFGSGTFFVFVATVPIFDSFKEVVRTQPNSRTANLRIVPDGATAADRDKLASGLAGAAVGPIFQRFFALSAACAWIALWTSFAWANRGGVHRWRFIFSVIAATGVAFGWPLSIFVSDLRELRMSADPTIAGRAAAAFGPWHVASLFLSMFVSVLTGIILLLAAKMPAEESIAVSQPAGSC